MGTLRLVEILVNSEIYGGGGIFGLYGTVAVDNDFAAPNRWLRLL